MLSLLNLPTGCPNMHKGFPFVHCMINNDIRSTLAFNSFTYTHWSAWVNYIPLLPYNKSSTDSSLLYAKNLTHATHHSPSIFGAIKCHMQEEQITHLTGRGLNYVYMSSCSLQRGSRLLAVTCHKIWQFSHLFWFTLSLSNGIKWPLTDYLIF